MQVLSKYDVDNRLVVLTASVHGVLLQFKDMWLKIRYFINMRGSNKQRYTEKIHGARRLRRKYETMYQKSKLNGHREMFLNQQLCVVGMVDAAKD